MLESHAFLNFGIATVVVQDCHTGRKDLLDHVYYRWTRSTYRATFDRYIGRLSVDYRSIVDRYIGRQSTDKCVDRYSLKPSILDRYMTDT